MIEKTHQPQRAASPLIGFFIVARLDAGRLVGRIVAIASDLAIVEALPESEIQGPGLLLLKLGGIALPKGRCHLFRSREEITQLVPMSDGVSRPQSPRWRSAPPLTVIDGIPLPNPRPSSS